MWFDDWWVLNHPDVEWDKTGARNKNRGTSITRGKQAQLATVTQFAVFPILFSLTQTKKDVN